MKTKSIETMTKIAASQARYIRLGPEGRWAQTSIEQGQLYLWYEAIPHELCQQGEWDKVTAIFTTQGMIRRKARDATRELRDFYCLGVDCLWITFWDKRLWWAFAEPDVIWMGTASDRQGSRMRRIIGSWRCTNVMDQTLLIDDLSTRLTQVRAYQMTLCDVKDRDYLLRRINAEDEPLAKEAVELRTAMLDLTARMIARLHWAEFETMVDLIFARSGWQRVSRVGGSQKDVDLILQQAATGEMAWVQVKSKARQSVLNDYVNRFRENGSVSRLFFVCHTPGGNMIVNDPDVHLWTTEALSRAAIRAGLFEWLIDRCG